MKGFVDGMARTLAEKSPHDGGAAFPFLIEDEDAILAHTGMTLRDYFAGQALGMMVPEAVEAILSKEGEDYVPGRFEEICTRAARLSYRMADAMLEARKR